MSKSTAMCWRVVLPSSSLKCIAKEGGKTGLLQKLIFHPTPLPHWGAEGGTQQAQQASETAPGIEGRGGIFIFILN